VSLKSSRGTDGRLRAQGEGGGAGFHKPPAAQPPSRSFGSNVVDDVMHIMKTSPEGQSETGIASELVMQKLSAKCTKDEVMSAINELCMEGALYSTIDEDHFRCVDFG